MSIDLVGWLLDLTPHGAPFYDTYSWLIQSTIYLSVTAVFILLFKLIFKNRLKARWHFLIWAILLIRFLVPVLPSSPVSVFNTVNVDESIIEQSSYQAYETPPNDAADNPSDAYDLTDSSQGSIEAVKEHGSGSSATTVRGNDLHIINITDIVVFTWMGGAVLLLLYFVIVYIVCVRRLKKQRSACGDNIKAILDSGKEQLGVKRNVRIYHGDTTPTLIGIFRPTIYLPEPYSEAELRNVLLHELCHMKHMDVLWSLLAVLILCMNWFNPIMWVCFFLFKRDIEVYCDERTLRYAEDKQSYAMLLLKTATARKERFILGTTSLQSGKADVKRRIRFMAKFKKPSVALVLIAVVLVGVMTTACLTNPVSKDISANTNDTTDLSPISNMDYEGIYVDDSFQVFHSKQSLEELRESVLYQQPADFSATTVNDKEFLVSWHGADTLFSKEIYGPDGKQLEDTYVIANEQRGYIDNGEEIHYPYPYHLTKHHWTLSESQSGYSLSYSNDDPFASNVQLETGTSAFTDLIIYYQDHNCDIQYEGGNLTGGIIFVTLDSYSGRLFRILVAPKDDNTFTMRFWKPGSPDASYAETVIRRYISAANEKDVKVFVDCFEEIDESAADDFLAGVKSCSFHNAEIFWIDEEQEKYIFKVSYRLITEDGKTIGSYGTGKMDLIEYFTVSTNNSDHEPLIVNKLSSFADCIHELSNNQ